MTLLIIGGIGYTLLILFVFGAMAVSGRASDREEGLRRPVDTKASNREDQPSLALVNHHRDAA